MAAVSMTVNGKTVTKTVDSRRLLVEFLREDLRLTGTHVGCDTSQCGACVVHVDGRAIKSCTALALSCEGKTGDDDRRVSQRRHAAPDAGGLPRASRACSAAICTPGMIMAGVDLVQRNGPSVDEHTIRRELDGNICRCTGYHNIVKAIAAGAASHGQRPSGRRVVGRTINDATGIGASRHAARKITALHHGQGPVRRRHQSPGPELRRVRALAACARDDQQDRHQRRRESAGRGRYFYGRRSGGRQGRRPDLRLDDPLQGRLADEGRRASGAGAGQGALCRRPRSRGHRRDLGAGARCGRAGRPSITTCCRRCVDLAKAQANGQPQVHAEAPNNTVYDWHLGDKAAIDAAFAQARHVTKIDLVNNRLIPNAMEPRAAIGDYDSGTGRLHALHHQPEPACGAAGAVGLHRHRAGEQAARHCAGRRRRLRLEDLHLCRRDGVHLGRQEGRTAGEVDRRPHAKPSCPTRMAAIT